jgi:hypothetical protein
VDSTYSKCKIFHVGSTHEELVEVGLLENRNKLIRT